MYKEKMRKIETLERILGKYYTDINMLSLNQREKKKFKYHRACKLATYHNFFLDGGIT